ncbi:uncharacterized protein B0T15DRAFT_493892 [Chaetomium strumarium]|uniref:Uncharacterized protein n=1 Tax=Chaetomium strumarium TaxID=1170767 RepID=A0AAJ0M1Q3_9PEZI|nr:hypothetical protein B0T15DRAFT_493892 [Chaetomium strumarium]
MKFAIATILAFASMAFAYPAVGNGAPVKRQNINTVDPATPSMSDASGNIVPFESSQVNQDAKAKGI